MNPPPSANQAWLLAGARSLTQPSDVFQISPDCERFVHGLKLRPIEWRTLFSVDGYRSVREIGSMLGLDEQTSRDIFGKLAVLRVIETDEITLDQFLERRPPGLAGDPPPGLAIGPAERMPTLRAESSEEKSSPSPAASVTVVSPAAPLAEDVASAPVAVPESEPPAPQNKVPAAKEEPPAPAAEKPEDQGTTDDAASPQDPPSVESEATPAEPAAPAPEAAEHPEAPKHQAPAMVSEAPAPVSEATETVAEALAPVPEGPAPISEVAPPHSEATAPVSEVAPPVFEATAPDVATETAAHTELEKPADPAPTFAPAEPTPAPESTVPNGPDSAELASSTPAEIPTAEGAAPAPVEAPPVAEPASAQAEVTEPPPASSAPENLEPHLNPAIVPTVSVAPPPAPPENPSPVPAPPIPLLGPTPARPPAPPPRPLVRSIFDDLAASRGPHLELPRTTRVPANTGGFSPSTGMPGATPVPAAPLLRSRPVPPPASRASDAPFRFEPPPAAGEASPDAPTPMAERPAPPLLQPMTAIRPVTPLPPPPLRPVISPRLTQAAAAIPPLSSPPFPPPPATVPAPLVTAPPPVALAKPFRLAAVIDFIMKQAGGGVIGQLAVYRVLLQVPPELLREAGIRSLEFDRAMEMEVRSPELQRALTTAVEKTLEVQVPPGQFTR